MLADVSDRIRVSRQEILNHLAACQGAGPFTTEIRAAFRSLR